MEFEIICDECKKVYYIILKGCEKIAKLAEIQRIDFSETRLNDNNSIASDCPYCKHSNVCNINERVKSWYILYNSHVNCSNSENETDMANNLIEDLKRIDNKNQNMKDDIIKLAEKLKKIAILGVISKNSNVSITLEEFKEAIKNIEESFK